MSAGVRPIPFGMPTLDSALGGLPSGTTTLLAGAPDAGNDAFVYTHLSQLMLAKHNPGLSPADVSRYGDAIPEKVVYVLHRYARPASHPRVLPIPAAFEKQREDEGPMAAIERKAPDVDSVTELLEAIAETIDEHAENAVVVVDSLSDLYRARRFGLKEEGLLAFLIGLRESAGDWNGLVHVLYDRKAEAVRAEQVLSSLMHGNIYFYSNDQGFETYRTMRVGSFGGALDPKSRWSTGHWSGVPASR